MDTNQMANINNRRDATEVGQGTDGLVADEVLDVVGMFCPMPAVKARLRLEKMAPGSILEIVATDAATKEDIPAWCESTGNDFLGLKEESANGENGLIRLYIRKARGSES